MPLLVWMVMSAPRGGWHLLGRAQEREALDGLVLTVRARHSRVLVLRGEAGVGKTALLDYVAATASGCRVVRVTGVESEMELPHAGLHQLCASMLDRIDGLAVPQREAVRTAFGMSEGEAPDRFLLSLAVLSLLSAAAEREPVIFLIDDAQWLDDASKRALAFVARRLVAESVALVFAVREPGENREFEGLESMIVAALGERDAQLLLRSAIPGPVDDRVRDRILAEAKGNPLALLQAVRSAPVADLAGGYAFPDITSTVTRVELRFVQQIRSLPEDAQRLLLVAAAEPTGDVALLWRAAEQLGIQAEAARAAETAGFVALGGRVRFVHPLVRTAAYRARPLPERRDAHRALADEIDPGIDPDRRAWHRALATVGLDEGIAAELEGAAQRAQSRGGIAAAAAFLERASRLTPDAARRGMRSLAAARAKFEAGSPVVADELLSIAAVGPLDDLQRAHLVRLQAQISFAKNRGGRAADMLLEAARRFASINPEMSRDTYLDALGAAVFNGRLRSGVGVQEVADAAARYAPRSPEPPRPTDLLLEGLITRVTAGYAPSVRALKRALGAFSKEANESRGRTRVDWLFTACPVAPEPIAPELWDDEAWNQLSLVAVRRSREAGALETLPLALCYRAGVLLHAGEFAAASAHVDEANNISTATLSAPLPYASLMLAAWRGREAPGLALIARAESEANERGEGRAVGLIGYVQAILHNGLGQYDSALVSARRACADDDLGFYGWSLAELIEAAIRCGQRDEAAIRLQQLEVRATAAGSDWALGTLARSQALMAKGDMADALHREAVERLQRTRITVHLARTHLLYGEWLRRENRRADARSQLKTAHELFTQFGAEAFAERARLELAASGESVNKRSKARGALTPQEAQVAWLAAQGRTNPEIASQLFISPRTAEYHLHKVFGKLGIRSRRELRRALPGEAAQSRTPSTGYWTGVFDGLD